MHLHAAPQDENAITEMYTSQSCRQEQHYRVKFLSGVYQDFYAASQTRKVAFEGNLCMLTYNVKYFNTSPPLRILNNHVIKCISILWLFSNPS